MKTGCVLRNVIFALIGLSILSPASADSLLWNRYNEFDAGLSPEGATPTVWKYEWTTGGSLASGDPWWNNPTQPLVWDDEWWNTGHGAWARGDDQSAAISRSVLTHNLYPASFDYLPVLRWENPLEGTTAFDLSGMLRVVWNGPGDVGSRTLVDVVVGILDAATGSMTLLDAWTVDKPDPADSVLDFVDITIAESIVLDHGDSLVFTLRGHDAFQPHGRWVEMWDLLDIATHVPAPSSALCFLLLIPRRRR